MNLYHYLRQAFLYKVAIMFLFFQILHAETTGLASIWIVANSYLLNFLQNQIQHAKKLTLKLLECVGGESVSTRKNNV